MSIRRNLTKFMKVNAILAAGALLIAVAPPAAVAQPPGSPVITVDPAEVESVQGPDEQVGRDLTIGNTGDADLQWSVYTETGQRLRRPIGSATPVHPVPPGTAKHGFLDFRNLPLPGVVIHPSQPAIPSGQVRLTHSDQQAIRVGTSATCATGLGLLTAATGFLRHYTPADFGITGDFAVSSVSFGVESFLGIPNDIRVNLYTIKDSAGPFVYQNFDLIATAKANLKVTHNLKIVQVPISATVPADATLVVEVATPDILGAGLRLASTPGGQSAPSYLRSKACGVPEPAETGALGLPHVQLLLNVTGAAALRACDVPEGTPWVGVAPTAGTVAPGGSQAVGLTFDSAGLAVGDVRAGELCLRSNDPQRPLVVVPVRLEVAAPSIAVEPTRLDAEQRPDEVSEQTLTISNHGEVGLEWTIEEAPEHCQAPADVPWLAVDPGAGQTGPGQSDPVTVTFDSTGLSQGDLAALLCVASNDPQQPVVEVPVTLAVQGVACDQIITGVHPGPLTVTEGITCLAPGARVEGQVNVLDGAGLVATDAIVQGPLATFGATVVEITGTSITGPVSVRGTTGTAALSGNQVVGSVFVVDNRTTQGPLVVSMNFIVGSLLCSFNEPAPVGDGGPNNVIGGMKLDQCSEL